MVMSPSEIFKKYPITNMNWTFETSEHQFHNRLVVNHTYIKLKLKLLIKNIRDPWYRPFPSNGRNVVSSNNRNGNLLRTIVFDTTVDGNLIECICFLEF